MNIISSDSSSKLGLWIVVEPEENEVIAEGKFDHVLVGKIRLDDVTVNRVGEQYHILYEDVSLEGHPTVYDSQAMFFAHALSENFDQMHNAQHVCMPCDFPNPMIEKIKTEVAKDGQTVTAKEFRGMLQIEILKDGEPVISFAAPTGDAYLDYIVSGAPRAKNMFFHKEQKRGPYGNEKVGAYVEKLNDKLLAAAQAVGLDSAYVYYDPDYVHIIVGNKQGRAAQHHFPGCILNYFVDNDLEFPFDVSVTDDEFQFSTDLPSVVPKHIMAALMHRDKWNVLQLIGLVK